VLLVSFSNHHVSLGTQLLLLLLLLLPLAHCVDVLQAAGNVSVSSLDNINVSDEMDMTSFEDVLEVMLTWLLEAQDALARQRPVSDSVTAVKDQFQQHEVIALTLS